MDRRSFVQGGALVAGGLMLRAGTTVAQNTATILDPDLPIVDSHHHLRLAESYLLPEYLADVAAGHKVVATVYVQGGAFARPDGPEILRTIGEVEFANGVAAQAASDAYGPCRVAAAIICGPDLRAGDAVAPYLDRALAIAPTRFRGCRTVAMAHPNPATQRYYPGRRTTSPEVFRTPELRAAVRALRARNLVYEAAVYDIGVPDVAQLAADMDDLPIVLEHMSQPMLAGVDERGRLEVLRSWRKGLQELARRPNVVCKIGGLGMVFWEFGFEKRNPRPGHLELAKAWQPWIETAIEAFGPRRCMMESNFPVDRASCSFAELWNAMKHATRSYSAEERAALFHGTATKVYRI